MSPEKLKIFRKKMNLTRKNLAAMLEVSEATVVRWEGEHKGKEPLEMKEKDSLLLETLAWLHEKATKTKEIKEETVLYSLILMLSGSTKHLKYLENRFIFWRMFNLSSTSLIAYSVMTPSILIQLLMHLFMSKKNKSIEKYIELYTEYGKIYGVRALLCIAGKIKLAEQRKIFIK